MLDVLNEQYVHIYNLSAYDIMTSSQLVNLVANGVYVLRSGTHVPGKSGNFINVNDSNPSSRYQLARVN